MITMSSIRSESDRLINCEQIIARLEKRIAELSAGVGEGSGLFAKSTLIEMLQSTLESWKARRAAILAAKKI